MGRGRKVSAERLAAVAATRYCKHCGTMLVRREDEVIDAKWLKRQNCNRACGIAGRQPRPRGIRKGPSDFGRTTPPPTPPPARDQCWAGFLVGRRCVLDRGGHVTHRDEAGREFVRAERRPVERTEHHVQVDSLAERPSMRSDWRSARGRFS